MESFFYNKKGDWINEPLVEHDSDYLRHHCHLCLCPSFFVPLFWSHFLDLCFGNNLLLLLCLRRQWNSYCDEQFKANSMRTNSKQICYLATLNALAIAHTHTHMKKKDEKKKKKRNDKWKTHSIIQVQCRENGHKYGTMAVNERTMHRLSNRNDTMPFSSTVWIINDCFKHLAQQNRLIRSLVECLNLIYFRLFTLFSDLCERLDFRYAAARTFCCTIL